MLVIMAKGKLAKALVKGLEKEIKHFWHFIYENKGN